VFTLTLPPIQGLGDGALHLKHPTLGDFYVAWNVTQITGNSTVPVPNLTDFTGATLVSSNGTSAADYNIPIGGRLRLTGQPDTATTVEVKLWQGGTEPGNGAQATAMRDSTNTIVPGWFELN